MTAVARMAVLDAWSVAPYRRQIGLMLVAAVLLPLSTGQPLVMPAALTLYAVLMTAYPFAVADKEDLGTLYGMLPLSRRDVVLGHYAWGLLSFAVALVAGIAGAYAIAWARAKPIDAGELGIVLALCTAVFAFVIAVQYPMYVRWGYTRVRLVANLPFFALVLGTSLLRPRADDALVPGPELLAALVGGALLLLAGSVVLSLTLDARRSR